MMRFLTRALWWLLGCCCCRDHELVEGQGCVLCPVHGSGMRAA